MLLRLLTQLLLLALAFPASAQLGWPVNILSPDLSGTQFFGTSIAADGTRLVVGVPRRDKIHVFHWNGAEWEFEVTLAGTDTVNNDFFGARVAIRDDRIAVLASQCNLAPYTQVAAVYIFRRDSTGWRQEAKLTPTVPSNALVGRQLALQGSRVALTAGYGAAASAHIFRFESSVWSNEQRILTSDSSATFGDSLSLGDDTIAIGIYAASTSAVRIYRRSGTTWSFSQAITPATLSNPAGFGSSIDIDADRMVVGATSEQKLFLYRLLNGTWTPDSTVADTTSAYLFGKTVVLKGKTLAAGAVRYDNGVPFRSAHIFEFRSGVWIRTGMVGDASPSTNEPPPIALTPNSIALGEGTFSINGVPDVGRVAIYTRADDRWLLKPTAQFRSSGMPATQGFGTSVAIAGSLIYAGSPLDDQNITNSGAARYFTRDGTILDRSLVSVLAPTQFADDNFGASVALTQITSKPSSLVGAPFRDVSGRANQGAAFFVGDAKFSSSITTLTASDGAAADNFGQAVSASGSTCAIGAPGDDTAPATNHGAVYLFEISNAALVSQSAAQTAKLTAPTLVSADAFGSALSIDGNTLVVGAPGRLTGRGSAFVFERRLNNLWELSATLLAPDGVAGDRFGTSVAIHADRILIGASSKAVGANAAQGAAYLFTRSGFTWSYAALFTAPDGAAGDSFGAAVATTLRNVIIGAPGDDIGPASNSGSVYIFTSATDSASGPWTDPRKFTRATPAANDQFGASVAADGPTFVAGAPNALSGAGEVLVFDLADTQQATVVFGPSDTPSVSVNNAILAAPASSRITASAGALNGSNLDLATKPLEILSRSSILTPDWSTISLANLSTLRAAQSINILGAAVTASDLGRSTIAGNTIRFYPGSSLIVGNHQLQLLAQSTQVDAPVSLLPSAVLTSSGDLSFSSTLNALNVATITAARSLTIAGSTNLRGVNLNAGTSLEIGGNANLTSLNAGAASIRLLPNSLVNFAGLLSGYTTNDGKMTLAGFSTNYGGFTNNGLINIGGASFSVYGPYINNGSVVGGPPGGCPNCLTQPASLTIEDSLTVSSASSITFGGTIEIGASFFSSASDPHRFDLRGATLRFNAAGAFSQRTIEAMSPDLGPAFQALQPFAPTFPLGAIEIGPGQTILTIQDEQANAPANAAPEAIYTDQLIIHSGSRLVTGSVRIYARSFDIRGTVDDARNLILLGSPCPADLFIDAIVDDADFSLFAVAYDTFDCGAAAMPFACPADLNTDSVVDDADFALFLTGYNTLLCP